MIFVNLLVIPLLFVAVKGDECDALVEEDNDKFARVFNTARYSLIKADPFLRQQAWLPAKVNTRPQQIDACSKARKFYCSGPSLLYYAHLGSGGHVQLCAPVAPCTGFMIEHSVRAEATWWKFLEALKVAYETRQGQELLGLDYVTCIRNATGEACFLDGYVTDCYSYTANCVSCSSRQCSSYDGGCGNPKMENFFCSPGDSVGVSSECSNDTYVNHLVNDLNLIRL